MALRRMNELWMKTMALALIFGLLLLHSCQGQEDTTQSAAEDLATTPTAAELATVQELDPTQTPAANPNQALTSSLPLSNDNPPEPSQQSSTDINATQTTNDDSPKINDDPTSLPVQQTSTQFSIIVNKKEIIENVENQAFNQDASNLHIEAPGKEEPASTSSSAVFASVLVTGLLLAAIIIAIYYFKFHRRSSNKGVKLAEESFVADEENQGNTLVSVAPLNQPEPQEKPQEKVSLNGESQEAVKPQTPAATNGHSTTKTADTEL